MAAYVAQQFAYAKAQGWLPFFAASASRFHIAPAVLMAIASRETNMRNIVGDGGHGYGVMQIDDRSFPDWCHSGAWGQPAASIDKGAEVLAGKCLQISHGVGQRLSVGGRQFVGKGFNERDPSAVPMILVAIACYNAGLWPYYSYSLGEPIDAYTTGKNYSTDVWARKAQFEAMLAVQNSSGAQKET